MTSAAFTVNGSAAQVAHEVAALSTVALSLVDTSGVNTVTWSIIGQAIPEHVPPTITKTGIGTATFPMVDAFFAGFNVQCIVNKGLGADGRVNAAMTSTRVVGIPFSSGIQVVPLCLGETMERNATVGWVSIINDILYASYAV